MDVKCVAVLRDVTRAFEPVSYIIKYITTFKIISPRDPLALKYCAYEGVGERRDKKGLFAFRFGQR